MIELVGPGRFKIDGKRPRTAKEARAEAVRFARGKKPILVLLKASPEAISDDDTTLSKRPCTVVEEC